MRASKMLWLLAVCTACGDDGQATQDAQVIADADQDAAITEPAALDGVVRVELSQAVTGMVTATVPEGVTVTYSIVTPPTKGTLTNLDAATGTFTYTSTGLVHDTDQFTFQVSDGVHAPSVGTIDVTIEPVLFTGSWALTNLLRNGAAGCTSQGFRLGHATPLGTTAGFFEVAQRRMVCGSTTYTIDPVRLDTTTTNPTDTVLTFSRSQFVSGCGTVTDTFRLERTATGFTYQETLVAPCAGGGTFMFTADATRTEIGYVSMPSSLAVGNAYQADPAPIALLPIRNLGRVPVTGLAVLTAPAAPFGFAGGSFPGTTGDCGTQVAGLATCSLAISLATTTVDSYASGYVQLTYPEGAAMPVTTVQLRGGVVPRLTNVTAIEAGGQFQCALANGAVACWGASTTPAPIPTLVTPTAVTAGSYHACAIDSTGVHCWGNNSWGQCTVPALTNPTAIAAGGEHTCALDDTGVVCWGRNLEGQRTVPALTTPTAITTGTRHSCALTATGIVCWGGSTGSIPALTTPTTISAGVDHNCAMTSAGVRCWGGNSLGQSTVPTLQNATAVTAGDGQSCAIANGAVVCWGRNAALTPALTNATAVTVGGDFACAIAGGNLRCWGNQSYP